MLLVKTELKLSPIHGFGVFAAEFITKGTRIWQYVNGVDYRISKEFVASLPKITRDTILHYSAFWGGGYVISADDSRFINHSFTPNLITYLEPDIDVALKDIKIGEELTEDYREFDAGRFIEREIVK